MDPGFDIIQSNRLELLAERLCDDLAEKPLSSPLAKELIIVQEPSVGKWLELAIARTSGIAANLRFLNPAQFFADLYRPWNPRSAPVLPYDPEILQWRTWPSSAIRRFAAAYPELDSYLRAGDQGRTFDLAGQIAQVFGRYLIYRMDWLAEWAANKEGRRGNDERGRRRSGEVTRRSRSLTTDGFSAGSSPRSKTGAPASPNGSASSGSTRFPRPTQRS